MCPEKTYSSQKDAAKKKAVDFGENYNCWRRRFIIHRFTNSKLFYIVFLLFSSKQTPKISRRKKKQKLPTRDELDSEEENEWSRSADSPTDPDPVTFDRPVFSETTGPHCNLDASSSALDFFELYFNSEMIRMLKVETNRYAHSTINELRRTNKLKKKSTWHNWMPVKLHEIYAFLALVLHMGIVRLPKISDYWSTDSFLKTEFSRGIMSRDRFMSILAMLHLVDNGTYINRGTIGYDPLFKIRPFFDHFLRVSSESYYPKENLCLDEAICPFRGRISFRVYIKDKPEKYGIKIYALTDCKTGYILTANVYTAKLLSEVNTIQSIFDSVCSTYYSKGYTIYVDRFYTSPDILEYLYSQDTLGVGTVMKNRKNLPKKLIKKELHVGEVGYRRKGPLLCIKWKDQRDVYLLSTKHKFSISSVKVRSKNGMVPKFKPTPILDYNKNKTGVDHMDQFVLYYPFKRRTMKWWKKLFFHLLIMATVNSYILYKKVKNRSIPLQQYIRMVGRELTEKAGIVMSTDRNTLSSSSARLLGRHFPSRISAPKKVRPAQKCRVCTDTAKMKGEKKRKETVFKCRECNVALCLPDCFAKFHTLSKYW